MPFRTLMPILITVAIAGVGFGASIPVLALLLERAGTPATLIGANTAMPALATFFVTPFVPRLLARYGPARLLIAALALLIVTFVIMRAYVDVWAWFPLRFLFGAGLAVLFTACEFWVNAAASPQTRGRAVGLYGTVFSAGWATGPVILVIFGAYSWTSVAVACALLMLAMLPLAKAGESAPQINDTATRSIISFLWVAPAATLAAFVYGGVEFGIFALLPVYALREGLDTTEAALMLTVLGAGNVALQYPLGWLADRIAPRRILLGCALTGFAGAVSLPFVIEMPVLLYATLFVWGGVVVGLYTIGLVMLGARFSGSDLASVNALVVMLYALGGLVTPPVSGLAMDAIPTYGLALVLGLICGAYALGVGWPGRRRSLDSGLRSARLPAPDPSDGDA